MKKDEYGKWSLVFGVLSIVLFWVSTLGIVFGVLAIIFSNFQKKIQDTENAKAGKITGIIGLVLSGLYLLFLMTFLIFYLFLIVFAISQQPL